MFFPRQEKLRVLEKLIEAGEKNEKYKEKTDRQKDRKTDRKKERQKNVNMGRILKLNN